MAQVLQLTMIDRRLECLFFCPKVAEEISAFFSFRHFQSYSFLEELIFVIYNTLVNLCFTQIILQWSSKIKKNSIKMKHRTIFNGKRTKTGKSRAEEM